MQQKLFTPHTLGTAKLKNRVVMAPMTRSRAINNIPNDLMAKYYQQRSEAGLIITEGTSPSPNGLGYARIPGIYSEEQVTAWRKTTEAVHQNNSMIFLQVMHTGRVTHPENLPGGRHLAPSAIAPEGDSMWVDGQGMLPIPVPEAMRAEDIQTAKDEYVQAAKNAIAAGFDGIELHGANGYLLEQFLHPQVNVREDAYGGSIANRLRFVQEVVTGVVEAIGKDKVGIRLSPYNTFNAMPLYEEIFETYLQLTNHLKSLDIVYIHLVDNSRNDKTARELHAAIRNTFKNTLILNGGYDADRAEKDLVAGKADLISFARPFISNPDLVTRFKNSLPLQDQKSELFYTPGAEGYTDYPMLNKVAASDV